MNDIRGRMRQKYRANYPAHHPDCTVLVCWHFLNTIQVLRYTLCKFGESSCILLANSIRKCLIGRYSRSKTRSTAPVMTPPLYLGTLRSPWQCCCMKRNFRSEGLDNIALDTDCTLKSPQTKRIQALRRRKGCTVQLEWILRTFLLRKECIGLVQAHSVHGLLGNLCK